MHKIKSLCLASALCLAMSHANAAIVTWNISTTFQDLKGTVTFNNAPIASLTDGAYDGSDTHIYGATISLTSVALGINHLINNAIFQPLTNTFDNKHIDSCWPCNVSSNLGLINLSFDPRSDQGNPAVGASSYYLYVNAPGTSMDGTFRWAFNDAAGQNNSNLGNNVPEPAGLALVGLGLLGLIGTRRKLAKS